MNFYGLIVKAAAVEHVRILGTAVSSEAAALSLLKILFAELFFINLFFAGFLFTRILTPRFLDFSSICRWNCRFQPAWRQFCLCFGRVDGSIVKGRVLPFCSWKLCPVSRGSHSVKVGVIARIQGFLLAGPVLLVNFQRQPAPLRKDLLQHPLQLCRFVSGDHGIFQNHLHHVMFRKTALRFAEHVVEKNAVIFKLHQNTVLVDHQKLLRSILFG